jgi:putative sugar O-methyltransferase
VELGAGYGRTAFCSIKMIPNVKYIIVDIPPALYISETYLSNIFDNKKVFKFRPFEYFREIEDEFNNSSIIFLLPDQLGLLLDKSVELFLAIDNLHAMRKREVNYYFNEADRIGEYFYFTCWPAMKTPFDNISYSLDNYPTKSNWKKIFQESCAITEFYVNSLYKIEKG